MKQPNLSVVTVCYNAVNDIGETTLSDINMARPLMARQPQSVAVPSTEQGGYILPSEEEGLVRGGALLAGETERQKKAFFNGKEGRDDFRKKEKI